MFGLFKNKCPLTPFEQTTVERYVYLLMKSLGTDRFLKLQTITPTSDFFREPYEPTLKGVRLLLQRIAEHLNLDATKFEIYIENQIEPQGAIIAEERVGEITKFYLLRQMLPHRDHVVTLLAGELCKHVGSIPETQRVYEHDPEVFGNFASLVFGFGIFALNAFFEMIDEWVDSANHTGSLPVHVGRIHVGYLDVKIASYTLAMLSYIRQEVNPRWVEHLRHEEAVNHFHRSLNYLEKTNDCLIPPNSLPIGEETPQELIQQLQTGTAQQRLRALWKIEDLYLTTPEVIEALCQCVKDREEIVSEVACDTLCSFGELASSAVPTLLEALNSKRGRVRVSAAVALGAIGQQHEEVLPLLRDMLFETHQKFSTLRICFRDQGAESVAVVAAYAIGLFGPNAKALVPNILDLFYEVVLTLNYNELNHLLLALYALVPDPYSAALAHFADTDDPQVSRLLEYLGNYEPPEQEFPEKDS